MVWSVPIRNWNNSCSLYVGGVVSVWSVPIRNWNPIPKDIVATAAFTSVKRTYKELKRCTTAVLVYRRGCVKRTYKELKLAFLNLCQGAKYVWSVPIRNWNNLFVSLLLWMNPSVKRTYKELKLWCYDWKIIVFIVWSVPIRNWN